MEPIRVAIAYDFDGTLAPGNMQEHAFIPAVGMSREAFWEEVDRVRQEREADSILTYMGLMLEKARRAGVAVRRNDLRRFGQGLRLFPGLDAWFGRIAIEASARGMVVEHYVISSGIKEMIEGTDIADRFYRVFASSFAYDRAGVAHWPAVAINHTTKTQYLYRISKGAFDLWNDVQVNTLVPPNQRRIPFENMMFIGDGETDVPAFRVVGSQGGRAVAVHAPGDERARALSERLVREERAHVAAPADYRAGSALDREVVRFLDTIACRPSATGTLPGAAVEPAAEMRMR